MPQGSKKHYTAKQEREAEHIAEGYKKRGVSTKTAKARAWATVNKMHGGGELKGGSGYGKPVNREPARKGARKAAATRRAKTTRRATAAKRRSAPRRKSSSKKR
jgi:hypothetical protein